MIQVYTKCSQARSARGSLRLRKSPFIHNIIICNSVARDFRASLCYFYLVMRNVGFRTKT